jgi:beta-N-acetylhexosaminidase
MRFLAVAVFAGLLLSMGEAAAQRFEDNGRMQWPDTPEISGEPAPANEARDQTRNPKAWPGTDGPSLPGTTVPGSRPPKRAATQAQPDSPPSQPAQPSQGVPPTQSAGADPGPVPVERRRIERAEPRRQDRAQPRQREAESTVDPALPPVPERGIATAQQDQARAPQTSTAPAEPAAAPAPADAAVSQPVPEPAAPEPVPQQVATPPAPADIAPEPPAAAASPVENAQAPSPVVAETPAAPPPAPSAAVPEPATVEQAQAAGPPPESAPPAAAETPAPTPQAETAQQPVPVNPPAEPQAQVAATPEVTQPSPSPDAAPAQPAAVAETPKADLAMPAAQTAPVPPTAAAQAEPAPPPAPKPDSALLKMIGQMIVTGFEGTAPEDPDVRRVIKELRNGSIGGVIVAERNINSSRQLKALTAALRGAAADTLPLLVVSHEGGLGQGMSAEKGFSAYPSASALGRSNDPLNAFNVYRYMAEELAAYGFNVNLGPVIDMDRFPADESADGRSYGISAKHVAAFAKAFRQAHQQKNIATVLKHFPPLPPPGEQAGFDSLDVVRELVDGGDVDAVMAASPREGAGGDKPVEALLRDGMGYRGVVVSDVEAKEQATSGPLDDRVRQAVAASSDLLLIGLNDPPAPDSAGRIGAVLADAVMAGVIKREAIEAAHDRIARLKESLGGSGNAIASADGKGERKPASPR